MCEDTRLQRGHAVSADTNMQECQTWPGGGQAARTACVEAASLRSSF